MKKAFLLLIITVLLFAFVACDSNPPGNEPSGSSSPETGAFSIGSKKYATLQAAVDALASKSVSKDVSEEYTIKLNADVTDSGAVISGVSVKIKIDFGSYIYTLANSSIGITVDSNNAGVIISGGIIALGGGNSFSSVITAKTDTTIDGVTINTLAFDVDAVTATGGTVKISGATTIKTKEGKNAISVSGNAVVTTTSSEVKITGGIELADNATLNLKDGEIEVAGVTLNGDSFKITISETVIVKPASDQNGEDLENLNNQADHTHAYSEDWSFDEKYHWHEPLSQDNPLKGNYEEHKWDRGVVTKAATCTSHGEIEYTCTECGSKKTVDIKVAAHSFSLVETKEATCNEDGYLKYQCSLCGEEKQVVVLALGHDFGTDNTCDKCGYTIESTHVHSFSEQIVVPTCNDMGYTIHQCSGCDYSYKDNFIEPTGHKWDEGIVTLAKTCTTDGVLTYHCQHCDETMTESIPKGHEYSYTILSPATCTESGLRIAVCDICGHRIEDDIIPASHSWNEGEVIKEASCSSEGLVRYTCSICGETEDVVIPATGHEFVNGFCTHCGHSFIDAVYSDEDYPEYGMYFHIDDIESAYGPNLINTYGVLLDFNDGAEIEKVGVYLTQDGTMWRRSLAFTGTGVTSAYYVPFLAYDSDIYYTGMNSSRINTFPLSKNSTGIYTYGNYTTIGVNLADKYGKLLLSLYDVGQAGAKTRVFDNLDEMIAWFNEGSVACTHNYGDWVVTKESTCSETGTKTRTCSICQDVQTELIPINSNNHSYSSEWTSDSTYHWHAVTCGHDVIPEKTEHNFGTNAVCTICGRLSDDAVTVSFDANGGDGSMAGITVLSGSEITINASGFTAPSGKVFAGWNTSSDGTGQTLKSGDVFTVTSNITLYAQWKEYNANNTPLTLEFIESGTLSFTNPRSSLQYSKNGGARTAVSGSIAVAAGDVISLYAEAVNQTDSHYLIINCTSDCYVYGNVMSLLDSENYATDVDISVSYALRGLFRDNTHIKNHPTNKLVLPATALASNCYAGMFRGCTGLTSAPELPATTLSGYCYREMFYGCTGLTSAPELPAMTLLGYCYREMFYGCTGLSEAPELPATILADYCYAGMFRGCTGLTSAPELPATTLSGYCYREMFSGCTGLTSAPELPATTLASYCYSYMFYGCTGFSEAPELPATTLASSCYYGMFSGCTGLTTAPELPAMKLTSYCYGGMFDGCTGLTEAPELPATTLASYCYEYMFYGCTGLTVAPELPATTLAYACYRSMFSGCTGLTAAPELPATTLAYYCYAYMFYGCENLSSITCLATNISADSCTFAWLSGVASNGTFTKASTMNNWGTGSSGIPSGWTVVNNVEDNDTPLTLEFIESGTLSFTNPRSSLQYSKNGGARTAVSGSIAVAAGDVISLYAEAVNQTDSHYLIINCTSDCYVYGNVMSLLDSENYATDVEISVNYALYGLFKNNTHIKNHPTNKLIMPATTLAYECYSEMFWGCTGLTVVPELPATTLASGCYGYMFYDCTGLKEDPDLPATTLASGCYHGMLRGCTGLTSAPELPALTLADGCYASMFYGCTGLTEAPELPATTLASSCYSGMFSGCTGLTEAPELPAMQLASQCYEYMFWGCTGLTTAPELLPAMTMTNSCYQYMFYGCTGLTAAPKLPATTLASYCYFNMFSGCTGLTVAPELPATTLDFCCYNEMFWGCTGLTSAPELPATTLADYCYLEMFSGCTGLTAAPELPATTLASSCYYGMLYGCTGLTVAPKLPATTLAYECYYYMFYGCTGLTAAPELPATTLTDYCYYGMFSGCTGLTAAPELPATTLANNCYYEMFYGCNNLSSITCLATDTSAVDCTYNWLYDVASNGTFTKASTMNDWEEGSSGIPSGWTVMNYGENNVVDNSTPLTLEFIESGTLSFTNPRSSLQYSKNGGERKAVSGSIAVAAGDVISLYAEAINQTSSNYLKINCTSDCYVYGNVMSLLDSENYATDVEISVKYALYGLFKNNTHIKNHPTNKLVLPATTLASYCYEFMFEGCTELTSAPALPATTLAYGCYGYMFYGCTGLTSAPALPATTLASSCYIEMFYGCTGLTSAPELPATTLADECYRSMFYGCTELTSAPALPATTLASYCYARMFSGCTGLTAAPELPATTLASYCYRSMFHGCTGLTAAPELPATTLASDCYDSMFRGCTGLTVAPELPATTLADYCYFYMFRGCTGLTSAPELPATTLADYCYYYMFYGCTNLSSITCLAKNISAAYCTSNWLSGVASNGTFTKASTMNNWGTGSSRIPSGWTVVNK